MNKYKNLILYLDFSSRALAKLELFSVFYCFNNSMRFSESCLILSISYVSSSYFFLFGLDC